MVDLSQPVEFNFILSTIGVILAITAIGVFLVRLKKVK